MSLLLSALSLLRLQKLKEAFRLWEMSADLMVKEMAGKNLKLKIAHEAVQSQLRFTKKLSLKKMSQNTQKEIEINTLHLHAQLMQIALPFSLTQEIQSYATQPLWLVLSRSTPHMPAQLLQIALPFSLTQEIQSYATQPLWPVLSNNTLHLHVQLMQIARPISQTQEIQSYATQPLWSVLSKNAPNTPAQLMLIALPISLTQQLSEW